MTDKEKLSKVRAEIEKYQKQIQAGAVDNRISKEKSELYRICVKLISIIDSLYEEPVSDVWYDAKKTIPEDSAKQIISIKEDGLAVATIGKIVTGTIKWAYLDTLLHISNKNLTESQCRKLIDTAFELGKAANKNKPVSEELEEEPIILTEEILKKNGFRLNPRPLYKYPYWSKLFTASDGRCYCFKIYMEQQIRETLMTVMPLASNEPGQPTCYLPHPKTIQQLEKSLRLFNIKFVIEV